MTEKSFLVRAAFQGVAELELGTLAAQKASSETVKEYAKRLIQSYVKANTELGELAKERGVALPTGIDEDHRMLIDRLRRLSGTDFDREFLDAVIGDHQKGMAIFKEESEKQISSELKSFAARILTRLEDYYYSAESIKREEDL
jgi:putative membrane protein